MKSIFYDCDKKSKNLQYYERVSEFVENEEAKGN